MSTSLYALVSGAAVLWLVEPILLTGLGAALLGLVPALAPAQRVCSCCAEFLAEVLDRWALWVSGWPGGTDLVRHRLCRRGLPAAGRALLAGVP
mgnify:CR=1 FL=1